MKNELIPECHVLDCCIHISYDILQIFHSYRMRQDTIFNFPPIGSTKLQTFSPRTHLVTFIRIRLASQHSDFSFYLLYIIR